VLPVPKDKFQVPHCITELMQILTTISLLVVSNAVLAFHPPRPALPEVKITLSLQPE
jgi:hypothetical protein